MPPYVVKDKCDGCKGKEEPLCEQICIGDLMTLDLNTGKAYCRSLRDCWDCMSCTKICPKGAIEQRIPYQLGYHGAKLIPMMGTDSITWTCVDINGKVERFTYRTRNKKIKQKNKGNIRNGQRSKNRDLPVHMRRRN